MLKHVIQNAVRQWTLCLLLLTFPPAFAAAGDSDGFLQSTVTVDIQAQGVATAMLELSKQARVQVLMPGGSLDSYRAPPLKGQMPLRAAIEFILRDTRHRYWASGDRVITVESEGLSTKR